MCPASLLVHGSDGDDGDDDDDCKQETASPLKLLVPSSVISPRSLGNLSVFSNLELLQFWLEC